jgi:hypothetical protein
MKIAEVEAILPQAWDAGMRIMLVGPPGCGKTMMPRQVGARVGRQVFATSVPLQSPVRIGGYPRPPATPDGDATHSLFGVIAQAFRCQGPGLLVLDDLGMGSGETLKAALDLCYEGRIDGRVLPKEVAIFGASNDVGHGADVQGMIEPLKDRWDSLLQVEPDVEGLVVHGLAQGWPGWVLAWLQNNPTCFADWKPVKSLTISGPTPRGIEKVVRWDRLGLDHSDVWAGAVGRGTATSMLAFRALQADLPDINQVLLDPVGAPVPTSPDARWLIGMALSTKLNGQTFAPILLYLQRLPQPLRFFCIRSAFHAESKRRADNTLPAGYRPIHASRDFAAWSVSPDGQDIMLADTEARK